MLDILAISGEDLGFQSYSLLKLTQGLMNLDFVTISDRPESDTRC